MIRNMYAVLDLKAKNYCIPYTSANHALAQREFARVVNTPETVLNANPEDFELLYIGFYDDDHGIYQNADEHLFIASGKQVKA